MKNALGTWLIVGICAGCASAQQQQPAPPSQQPAANANPNANASVAGGITPDSPVDDILDALDRRGDELKDFTANVSLTDTDTAVGNETKMSGKMWMQRIGADDARLRVNFDRRQANEEQPRADRQEFMLAGGMLTERMYTDRKEIRRQVLQPGQKMNLLKLGEGPFPLPLGQDKADVHKMFEVKKIAPANDDPPGTVHVQLTPKPASQFADRFATIEFWVDPRSSMPVRIVTMDPNGTTQRTTELTDVKVNANLGDKDFQLEPVSEKEWEIRTQAYDG